MVSPNGMDANDKADLAEPFSAAMDRLGPFEPAPRLAIAVSGGADSMALALLVQAWAARRGGTVLALTVDHGLRAESSAEADLTLHRLAGLGIPGRRLTVTGLIRGPALARRARDARYRSLLGACAAEAIVHLLAGHHRADQVETVMMRALASSGAGGLAGMPALTETRFARLLRPLLDFAPERLRALLTARGVAWVEDPSNRDRGALRVRLREAHGDPAGGGEGTLAVAAAAREAGTRRARLDRALAEVLARRATIRPEGYAVLTPGPIEPKALAALLRCVAGADYAPPIDRVAVLARELRPATLGGVRILRAPGEGIGAGIRTAAGWLLIRERRAMAGPVTALRGAVWDRRFRLIGTPPNPADRAPEANATEHLPRGPSVAERVTLGALGADAARHRNRMGPPALILQGLPALRLGETLLAVPHLGIGDNRWRIVFDPRNPPAGAPFGCA